MLPCVHSKAMRLEPEDQWAADIRLALRLQDTTEGLFAQGLQLLTALGTSRLPRMTIAQ